MKLQYRLLWMKKRLIKLIALLALMITILVLVGACSLFNRGREEQTPTPLSTEVLKTSGPDQAVMETKTPASILPEDEYQELISNLWVLVGYGNPSKPIVVEEGIVITAEFQQDGTLTGSAGCNNYQAGYEVSGNRLVVGPVATTMMICDSGMQAEEEYLSAMQSAQSFSFTSEGRLEVAYNLGTAYDTRLVFVQGQTPLTGTIWVLESYGSMENPNEVVSGTSISAVLTEDGILSGNSGCNNYSAVYEINQDGGEISITPPVSTRKMCPNGMEQEALYLSLLPKAESYQVIGRRMHIYYDNGNGSLNYTSIHYPLENTLWTLVALNGGPIAENAPLTMQFSSGEELDAGTVGGIIGCNNFSANYDIDEQGELSIDQVITTFMACTPDVMEIEQSYFNTLSTVERYQILGDHLTITSPLAILTFAADRTPLEGTLWSLVSLGDADNPLPPAEGSNFTAQFQRMPDAPTGVVAGTTGCNTYQSTYVASLTEIKVNPVNVTGTQACAPEIIEQEQVFSLGMSAASTYQIVGNALTINFGDKGVLNFIAVPPIVDQSPDLTPLNGTFWFMTSINDMATLPETQITASFNINPDQVSGEISGSSGCNSYSSKIEEGFHFNPPIATQKNCEEPVGVMDQERLYLDMLQKVRAFSISGEQLIMVTSIGQLRFSSSLPESNEDQGVLLINRNWYLISINNNAAIPGYEPRSYFAGDGTLNGQTGCNLYSARYETKMSSIAIAPVAKTGDPCDGALLVQEQAFINALQAATEFRVSATTMQLIGVNGVLNFSSIPPRPINPTGSPIPPATFTPTQTIDAGATPVPPGTGVPQPTNTRNATQVVTPAIPLAVISSPLDGYNGKVNIAVEFDASGSAASAGIALYTWDFGDGTDLVETENRRIEHVYEFSGFYTVTLTVKDRNGVVSDPVVININIQL